MVYYTIYVRNLHTNTGYIDVALQDDQLLKDFIQCLDVGLRSHRTYPSVDVVGKGSGQGQFAINLADVAAITVIPASQPGSGRASMTQCSYPD